MLFTVYISKTTKQNIRQHMSRGGIRPNSGRKKKIDEVAMIEKLSPLDDLAFEKLRKGIEENKFQYLKLYMSYRYGRPKEVKEIDLTTKQFEIPTIVFKRTEEMNNN